MNFALRASVVLLTLLPSAAITPAWATPPNNGLEARIRRNYPVIAAQYHSWSADQADRSSLRLADGPCEVVLQRLKRSTGIETLRVNDGRAVVLLEHHRRNELGYRVVRTTAIKEIVSAGRGVRFVSGGGCRGLELSPPQIVDATGRPSPAARWLIDRSAGRDNPILSLHVDDRALRYPIAATFGSGRAEPLAPQLRPAFSAVGALSGSVTAVGSGVPIPAAAVFVYDSNGEFVTFTNTDATGAYAVGDLEAGTYRILFFAENFLAELYNDVSCADFACDISLGAAVTIAAGATTANVNAALSGNATLLFGNVSGQGGGPLGDVTVVAYDAAGTPADSTISDPVTGDFKIVLPGGGTYFVRTFNNTHEGYVDRLYGGVNCVACDVTAGTPVTVVTGSISTISITLEPNGGRIAGRLTDAVSGEGLALRRLLFYNSTGELVSFANANETGSYLSFHGLVTGSYFVFASAVGYTSEVFDDVPCAACDVTTGAPVTVTLGSTTSGIDIALENQELRVSGQVKDLETGAPLGEVAIHFFDSLGRHIVAAFSRSDTGTYSIALPRSGRYYARTSNAMHVGYVDKLYSNIDCSGCPVAEGTPIDLVPGTHVENVDFALAQDGGDISGTITDTRTASGVPSSYIQVYSSSGDLAAYGFADSAGGYSLYQGLTAGTFFVVAHAAGYVTELFDGMPCGTPCNITGGTPVTVVRGVTTPNINFSLAGTSSSVTGHVRRSDTSAPLAGIVVAVYSSATELVSSAATDIDGRYEALVAGGGTYYARTQSAAPQFADQLYAGLPCDETCEPLSGTPITVTDGESATGVDFNLISLCDIIDLQPPTLSDGTVGDAYDQQITASGVAPVTFEISSGSLPDGLTLSEFGLVSGTPTSPGSFTFNVLATDAMGCTGSRSYSISTGVVPTTTLLTASPADAGYGTPVTLTATVTPASATGTVSFVDGSQTIGQAPLSVGVATFVVATLNAGAHQLTAVYSGSASHASSSSTAVLVTITPATPVIVWSNPSSITYPTLLSSTQLNATTNVPGTFVYVPAAGSLLDADTHTLSTTFHPADTANYNDATAFVSLIVTKVTQTIVWVAPADIVYGTVLGASQLNAAVTVPGPSPAGVLTYDPPAGTLLGAGSHLLTVSAAETNNYHPAQASVAIEVLRASPVIMDLNAPEIIVHTSSVVITGRIAAGALVPPGAVVVSWNGDATAAPIQIDGTFAVTLQTEDLNPMTSGYPITVEYAGSANFSPVSASTLLTVVFGTSGGALQPARATPSSTIPFRVRIIDVNGVNLSTHAIAVTAYGVRPASSDTWVPPTSPGNSGAEFKFQHQSYLYTLKTTNLLTGDYLLGFTVAGDPTIHTVAFSIR